MVRVGFDTELNSAFCGEFDGVTDEIGEDLADAAGIGNETRRQGRRVANGEVELLFARFGMEEFGNFLDDSVERAGNGIDGHLAGFDL